MGLGHLQREGGSDRGVEGVAAALQRRHANRGGNPVCAGDDAERALDLRGEGSGLMFFIASARWRKHS